MDQINAPELAATSVVHNVPLLTRDRKILRFKLVPFAS